MPGVLGDVHGSVSGAEQAVARCAVFGVNRYADASGAIQDVAFDGKRLFKTTLQPSGNLLNAGAGGNVAKHGGKLIAAQPRQLIVGAKLALHAMSNLLQVEVADLVAINVVDQLELIQIDIDKPEDAGIEAGQLDARFEKFIEGKAIVQVGEQVKFRTMQQVGVKPAGFNGQAGEPGSQRQSFRFGGGGLRLGIECGKERAERDSAAGGDDFSCDAHRVRRVRRISQSSAIGYFAPCGSSIQPERKKVDDCLEDFCQRARSVDLFEDAAAALLNLGQAMIEGSLGLDARGQRGSLAANLPLQSPSPDAGDEQHQKKESDEKQQIADVQQRGLGDHGEIVERAHEDGEWYLGIERVGVIEHADAADANPGIQRNLAHGRSLAGSQSGAGRMAKNGGKHLAILEQNILILIDFRDLGDHLTLNRHKVEDMAAQGEFTPVRRLGRDGRKHGTVLNCPIGQGEKAIVQAGEAGYVGHVADAQRGHRVGLDPQALGAVLQNHGGSWLVVGDGPVDTQSLREHLNVIARQDLIHGRDGKRGRIDGGAFEHLDAVPGGNMDQDPGLLHLAVEFSRGCAGNFDIGVEQARQTAGVAAIHDGVDGSSICKQLEAKRCHA